MNEIKELLGLDWKNVIYIVFVLMFGITMALGTIERFSQAIGKPVKWIKKNDEDHKLLLEIAKEVKSLKDALGKACNRETEIEERLEAVSAELLDKRIEDYRYKILNFASALATGKEYSKDQYDHVIGVHDAYERLLDKHNMTNSQTDISMRIIEDAYAERMKNGFHVSIENK